MLNNVILKFCIDFLKYSHFSEVQLFLNNNNEPNFMFYYDF